MKREIAIALGILVLAGCESAATRMERCEDHGISRDTCYLAEQNRQAANHAAAMNNAEQLAIHNRDEANRHHNHTHY
jgi:hypothetical protein